MSSSATILLVPPELLPFGALSLPCPVRASYLCATAAKVRAARRGGVDVRLVVEPGTRTARDTADRFASGGGLSADSRLIVLRPPGDGGAADALVDALCAAGRTVGEAEGEVDWDDVAPPGAGGGRGDDLGPGPVPRVLLVAAGDGTIEELGVVFARTGGSFVRRTSGAAEGVAASIDAILPVRAPGGGGPRTLVAIDPARADVDVVRRAVDRVGRAALRILPTEPPSRAWEPWFAAAFPAQMGWLRTLVHDRARAVLPLVETYAGRSIVERNAELLVNIVP